MGRGFRSSRVMAAVAMFAVMSCAARAAGEAGDAVRGEKKFYTCYGCHGIENYRNAYPNYEVPKLRGQHAAYLSSALHEYQSGERPHATMHAQSVSLSEQDIADITAYLQGTPIKPTSQVAGSTPAQAGVCGTCHGVNGSGVEAPLDPKPPVLAGQHDDYLEQALTAYQNGRRKNAVMGAMAQGLKPEDIKILAAYFSRQASPLTTARK